MGGGTLQHQGWHSALCATGKVAPSELPHPPIMGSEPGGRGGNWHLGHRDPQRSCFTASLPTSPPLRLQIPSTIRHYQLAKYSGTRWNRDLLVGRNLWLCSLLHKSCKNSVADGFCSRVSDLKCLSTKVYNRAVGIWELVYRLFHRDHSIILNGSVWLLIFSYLYLWFYCCLYLISS